MSDYGFPSHHSDMGSADSFWPSFADIMMVIVMVFLLVTVAVVLTNSQLLADLKLSLQAEQKATAIAENTQLENASLEDQLAHYKEELAAYKIELLQTQAKTEKLEADRLAALDAQNKARQQLQEQTENLSSKEESLAKIQQLMIEKNSQLATVTSNLQIAESEITKLQQESLRKSVELDELKQSREEEDKRLATLESDYAELDKKYQKLLKPARSTKNKQVVEVRYEKGNIGIRQDKTGGFDTVSRIVLEEQLAGLKEQFGDQLYVKIIIPEDSGLSYNEAWSFTQDILQKYDYYYQDSE